MARARGRRWRLEDLEQGSIYTLRWDTAARRWEAFAWGSDEPLVTKPAPPGRAPASAAEATKSRGGDGPAGRHRAGP